MTEADIKAVVDDAVQGAWERRAGHLTGEWIVYAVHEGRNYYLCLGDHKSEDCYIRSKIDTLGLVEFPFLAQYLQPR